MELSWLLDPRTYQKTGVSTLESRQRAYAIRAYLKFNRVFNDRQVLSMDGRTHEAMATLFEYSFAKFAVTIYKYKLRQTAEGSIPGDQLRRNILDHVERFRKNTADQVKGYMGIAAKNLAICATFEWDGSDFTVETRTNGEVSMTGNFNLLAIQSN